MSGLIELQNVGKSFGGARALADVSLTIDAGEVHALCGENGAGKSTLIKVLGGSHAPDSGRVLVNGVELKPSVRASESAGIAVIHQELVAFPHLSAIDNVFVGREPRRLGGLVRDRAAMRDQTRALLQRLGEDVDLHRPLGELPMAQRQMVGIARALSQDCKLLIMDEPTASLSARETDVLFRVVRDLRASGVSVLYVSHRMEEIFALADRVSVLRDGRHVATKPIGEVTNDTLIKLMVGREVELIRHASAAKPITPSSGGLEVRGLRCEGVFDAISFDVRPGEIVALAGLVGAGRSEVVEAIFGATRYEAGTVTIDGVPLKPGSIHAAIAAGVGLVPEDRQHLGLVLPMSVGTNLTMAVLRSLTRGGLVSGGTERSLIRKLMDDLHVRAASHTLPAEALSGGNQQKLVIGKWLAHRPKLLILDEPTRGVDVGAKAEIHRLIVGLTREHGMATLVISSELPEVLALADRILVMRAGRIAGELSAADATQERILSLALPDAVPSPREVA